MDQGYSGTETNPGVVALLSTSYLFGLSFFLQVTSSMVPLEEEARRPLRLRGIRHDGMKLKSRVEKGKSQTLGHDTTPTPTLYARQYPVMLHMCMHLAGHNHIPFGCAIRVDKPPSFADRKLIHLGQDGGTDIDKAER